MDFDTEKFIIEVQKRPAIWKYADKIQRYRDWKELAEAYGAQTDDEAKQLALRLQKKWKNIRDCFVKTHKAKTGKAGVRKRKIEYAFYDNLLFLLESECLTSYISEETLSNSATPSSISTNNFEDGPYVVKIESTENDPLSSNDSWSRKRSKFEIEVPTETVNKKQDEDAHLFCLSLVKEFNKIPEHLRIQTKIDLLKVIKDAQFSGY